MMLFLLFLAGSKAASAAGVMAEANQNGKHIKKVNHVENVPCTSTTSCPDGDHCCFYSTGDPAGCCPNGETCDVDAGLCLGGNDLIQKPIIKAQPVENVPCTSTTSCPDGDHCCFYSTGDPAGCCPNGETCDVDAGLCLGAIAATPIKNKKGASMKKVNHVENVPCTSTTSCPDGDHCCFYSTGDPAGCCPNGETCDVDAGLCLGGNDLIQKPIIKAQPVENVPCTSTTSCPDGDHCCFYSTGDVAGCCPNGETCDADAGLCLGAIAATPIKK